MVLKKTYLTNNQTKQTGFELNLTKLRHHVDGIQIFMTSDIGSSGCYVTDTYHMSTQGHMFCWNLSNNEVHVF